MSSKEKPCIFVVAGEPSGDRLGADAIEALKETKAYEFCGIGGPLMEEAGDFRSLVPLQTLSVMGLGFLKKMPQILCAFLKAKRVLAKKEPDVFLSFDAPDFALRLVQYAPPQTYRVHCVAPSVWAWRPGRALKIAKKIDHLLALFPFEPPYFEKHGLKTTFVGHPKAERVQPPGRSFWRLYPHLSPKKPLLLLMPGSRAQEIKTLLPLFLQTARAALEQVPGMQVVLLTLPAWRKTLEPQLPFWVTLVSDPHHHGVCMRAATAALVASGTATLELGLATCPMVVAYKVSFGLAAVLRQLIKTPFAALPNILHQKEVVPECLQEGCAVDRLLHHLLPLLRKESAFRVQKKALLKLGSLLRARASFGESVAKAVHEGCLQKRKGRRGSQS